MSYAENTENVRMALADLLAPMGDECKRRWDERIRRARRALEIVGDEIVDMQQLASRPDEGWR